MNGFTEMALVERTAAPHWSVEGCLLSRTGPAHRRLCEGLFFLLCPCSSCPPQNSLQCVERRAVLLHVSMAALEPSCSSLTSVLQIQDRKVTQQLITSTNPPCQWHIYSKSPLVLFEWMLHCLNALCFPRTPSSPFHRDELMVNTGWHGRHRRWKLKHWLLESQGVFMKYQLLQLVSYTGPA